MAIALILGWLALRVSGIRPWSFAGGWATSAYRWVERNGGMDVESDYPYANMNSANAGMCNAMKAGDNEVSIDGFAGGMSRVQNCMLLSGDMKPNDQSAVLCLVVQF